MKRIVSLILVGIMSLSLLAGCGKTQKNRILYSEVNLKKNVTLGEYKGVTVDTASKEFKEYYNNVVASDVSSNNLYVKKTEGTVAKGDVANIDYEGKKDGVAFEGGTAKGYDLEIGSNSFIAGFEEGLIGKEIGSTVDLNLTFPEEYQAEDLAGKAVVFTVKINHVTTKEERKPEDFFEEIGFKSLEEYEKDVKDRAIENYLLETFLKNSKVKKYSKKDQDFLLDSYISAIEENLKGQYNMTVEDYLKSAGQTMEAFKETALNEQIIPTMDSQMPVYALLDAEDIKIVQKDIDTRVNAIVKDYGSSEITAKDLKDYYGEYYFENLIATEKAIDFMVKNATIK